MGYQGGWATYPDKVVKPIFARSECTKTKTATIKAGQVLKAYTWLESDGDGKLIAHSGFNEGALVTFAAITSGQTLILGGITFTSGASGTTAAQLATAWSSINVGDDATAATTKIAAAGITAAMGTFTAGTLAGWETELYSTTKVMFNSTAPGTNPTNLADSGTATDPAISIVGGETALNKIAGMTVYDVNANPTSGAVDVEAAVFIEASFYMQGPLWAVDTAVDTVTNADGTTTACTAYNTGCAGTSAASNLLKQKFIEGSEFTLDVIRTGEVY